MGNAKKLRTQIKGLDDIFYGGINVDDSQQEGTLIAIFGSKGVNKIQLAIQMVQGLTESLWKERGNENCNDSLFYSINKRTNEMRSILTNILVYRDISDKIQSYRLNDEIKPLLEVLKKYFDLQKIQGSLYADVAGLADSSPDEILSFLSDGSVYYNERTSSLNIQQVEENDSCNNTIKRRFKGY